MLRVSDLADRRVTVLIDPANFARRQTDLSITRVTRHQSRRAARRTNHLPTTTGCQFNIMNGMADRNCLERQRVADFRRSRRATGNLLAYLDTRRSDNITLFAVRILEQRQAS